MIQLIAQQIYARRKAIIVITIILTIIFAFFMTRIRINPDITTYFPENDRVVKLFNYIGQEFGGNLLALVVLETDDVFSKKAIENIQSLTRRFRTIEGVNYVTSLTNILDIKTGVDGIEIGRLIDEYDPPETEAEWYALRQYTLKKDFFKGNIVSEDGKAALIICRLNHEADKIKTTKEIIRIVDSEKSNGRVYYGGFPFFMLDISRTVINDLMLLTPLVGLVIVIILAFGFRSFRGVIMPVMTALISIIWTMGLMGMTGTKLAIVSDIIPVILFAVGTAYSIHVLSRFNEDRGELLPAKITGLARVMVPVLLAAITTVFGFVSFIFGSYLTMIREFGIFAALGIIFSLLISLTFVPSLLFSLTERKKYIDARKDKFHLASYIFFFP